MLAHGFHPVQTERMQHGTRAFHHAQNCHREHEPAVEDDHHHDGPRDASEPERILHRHVPEHNRETLMGQGQRPETKVGCRVRDTVEAEFYVTPS